MAAKGKLITLEGIDGTGKSSITQMLGTSFPDAVITREPSLSWLGKAVKRSIESDTDPLAELFLFIADHAEHVAKVIRPALVDGKMVISDRYSDSRYAYQGVTLSNKFDDAMEWIRNIHKGWTIVPDLTILFTIDPEVAVLRCAVRGDKTKFEKIEFLGTVQENFMLLAEKEPHRFVLINAGNELDVVAHEVNSVIENFIRK